MQPVPLRVIRPAVWESVAAALRDRCALEILHRKVSGEESTREIEPYSLVPAAGNWMVVARAPEDTIVKNFYLSRIVRARLLTLRYSIPKDFSAEKHFGESLGIFTGKDSFRFRVRFTRDVAPWVSEIQWHSKQKLRDVGEGEVELELPTASMWEARRFELSFGKHARAVAPVGLVGELGEELRAMVEWYARE
ncbi:MAG: WYL domain-containing protein [Thermoanaerobaculia bacterium]